ncbi:MAG TPA: hypothetical protein PLR02_13875 [Rhodocyclaceae bacterium]|nr:hypothetical protein [Rhodocyclaceae bacterium]
MTANTSPKPGAPAHEPNLLKEVMPGPRLAILAESLFLANLMIIPGLGFALLVALWFTKRGVATPLELNHLEQTVVTSLWGGAILVGVSAAIFVMGGFGNPVSWVVGIIYFTCFHASLILLGVLGLNRAILGKPWRFPILGPALSEALRSRP